MTPRRVTTTLLAGAVALGVVGAVAPHAVAGDSPYPSASAEPPVEIDPHDTDLKLPEGATLAAPKVLDIKSVIEDLGGEERREDTNADIKFALQAEVLFGKDSAKLSGEAKGRINAIAEEIKRQDAKKVRVFGFTDDLGSSEHGDVLSKKRAEAVHNVLDEALGGSGITFEIRGYGEDYPIASNDDEDGRRKNRRVEVSFQRGETETGSQS
ncbi:OmpA family protein [Streptomyces drozdowiczii]|uniref:OmpA family protein n=1 Tax=Streptomyces drozdowiczii TaxID=202862 RepID=A0ABY6PQZ7_9ACTN|nr:OmpA family protein [Streptomyces drozdowiczii]MCX0245744.1 OmpA family protein [Streptomyces drozdowiczii]UZK54652.1 OmpA family protein [Streptomyces drozdowiczii]